MMILISSLIVSSVRRDIILMRRMGCVMNVYRDANNVSFSRRINRLCARNALMINTHLNQIVNVPKVLIITLFY